jgi:hypothetical protein
VDAAEENNKCFVISPIGTSGTDGHQRAKNVLTYMIRPAATAVGLEAVRADDLAQPGSITTQVIQQLISAKMVVADLSELNPNVFYELAVRDSFGLPVVLIAEEKTALPFDLIQQRTIFFDSGDLGSAIPARDLIERAMREALEDPSAGSPVTAAVDLNALRSGNPEERQVADLAEQVSRLSQEVVTLRQEMSYDGQTRSSVEDSMTSSVARRRQRRRLAADLASRSSSELLRLVRHLAEGQEVAELDRIDGNSLLQLIEAELDSRSPRIE